MLRRVLLGVALCTAALLAGASAVAAQTYPPVPPGPVSPDSGGPGGGNGIVGPDTGNAAGTGNTGGMGSGRGSGTGNSAADGTGDRVVVVQGVTRPASPALGNTGLASTLPSLALATGSVLLGVALLRVARRGRRNDPEPAQAEA